MKIQDNSVITTAFAIFSIVLIFCLLFSLRTWALWYPFSLNPDEAQMIANAMKAPEGAFNWDKIDGGSSGPLNSVILAWPYLLNLEPTFFTARLTTIFLVSVFTVFMTLSVLRMGYGIVPAILPVCFLAAISSVRSGEFVHYSSETTPIALLSIACFLSALVKDRKIDKRDLIYCASSSFLLGLIPYVKLQAAPIALSLGIILLLICFRKYGGLARAALPLAVAVFASLLPSFLILSHLLSQNAVPDFLISYIFWAIGYVGGSPIWLKFSDALAHDKSVQLFIVLTGAMVAALLLLLALCRVRPSRDDLFNIFSASFVLIVSVASVGVRGNVFPHYIILLFPGLILVGGVSMGIAARRLAAKRWRIRALGLGVLLGLALLQITVTVMLPKPKVNPLFSQRLPIASILPDSPKLLMWLPVEHAPSLSVWGWMPQWYVMSSLPPATREATSYNQVLPLPNLSYFQERYLRELKSSKPAVIIDAVAPGSFAFYNPDIASIHFHPALSDFVSSEYEQLTSPDKAAVCPRIYLRKGQIDIMAKGQVRVRNVIAEPRYKKDEEGLGPENLVDNSVFDTCPDYWRLPRGELGSVTLQLEKPSRITSVGLLNSVGGRHKTVASGEVALHFIKDGEVHHSQNVSLFAYPYWTTVTNADQDLLVDEVRIDVMSILGNFGGLNEVKLFKE